MAGVLAVVNQKGGVGKTTTTINLAAACADLGQNVLLIDSDPQGSATLGCGLDKNDCSFTLNDVLLEQVDAKDAVVTTDWGFGVLPANDDLTEAEVNLVKRSSAPDVLKRVVSGLDYDWIFIDCPPSLNTLTVNAFVAADGVLVPIQCEYYALEGLKSLLASVDQVRQTANPSLSIEGIVRTMYDGRNRLSVEVSSQLLEHFGDTLYETVIPRNIRVAEAPSYGEPITRYDARSLGAIAYKALAKEFLERQLVAA